MKRKIDTVSHFSFPTRFGCNQPRQYPTP